jgi:topoisomerase-4 subunit A
MGLAEVLGAWVLFQLDMLVRRASHRVGRIDDRLELLEGYLIAFLNLDRVIEIIRTEDEPKPVMIAEFALSDRQAEAILNMRLRSLRKLEEMQLKAERDALLKEREGLQQLIESPARQRNRLKRDLAALRERYGPETPLGRRRTLIEEAGPAREIPLEAMIEREPITVILSKRGWIRAMKGHVEPGEAETLKFKEGDELAFPLLHAQTTDKLLLASSDGRFYTLAADKLPGGRGFGEPVKSMVDIESEGNVVALLRAAGAEKLLVASSDGRGFVTPAAGAIAETRKGKQIVNLRPGAVLRVVRPLAPDDDFVAVVGANRKLVVFPLAELPEMGRGQGVQLQRYRDGGLADTKGFARERGLSWPMGGEGGRVRTEDMDPWRTARGAAGRMPPTGFPRDNRFG